MTDWKTDRKTSTRTLKLLGEIKYFQLYKRSSKRLNMNKEQALLQYIDLLLLLLYFFLVGNDIYGLRPVIYIRRNMWITFSKTSQL